MATAQVAPISAEIEPLENLRNVTEAFYWLPCSATAEIAVPGFTVGDLLRLREGTIVQTPSAVANSVPVRVNNITLGSGQFEVVEDRLAVRITEFA